MADHLNSILLAILFFYWAVSSTWFAVHGLSSRLKTAHWTKTRGTMTTQNDYYFLGFLTTCSVKYKYEVEGKVYYGKRTDNWDAGTNPGLCRKLAERTGENEIIVYYDPKSPKNSLLDNTLDPFFFCFLTVAGYLQWNEALSELVKVNLNIAQAFLIPLLLYNIFVVISILYVGATNFSDYFSSSLLAVCLGLWFVGIFVQVLIKASTDIQSIELRNGLIDRQSFEELL